MEGKKTKSLNFLYFIAIIFMIAGVVFEVIASKKAKFGLYDILAWSFIFVALVMVVIPIIMNSIHNRKQIKNQLTDSKKTPKNFVDYVISDYVDHNLVLDIDTKEKQSVKPIIDYEGNVSLVYHTLLEISNELFLLDVYFYHESCLILFDEGKVKEYEIPYKNDFISEPADLYGIISNKVRELTNEIFNDLKALKQ